MGRLTSVIESHRIRVTSRFSSKGKDMNLEIALLGWGDERSGVHLIGRTYDAALVDAVREHLIERLETECAPNSSKPNLRLLASDPDREDGDEGPAFGGSDAEA